MPDKTPIPLPIQPDALFRAAADQAPQVMWIVNPKGAVTYLNRFWYELVGGEPPKWYGHEWTDAVLAEDVAEMRERWKQVSTTGAIFEGLRRVRARDGVLHTLAYKASPVRDAQGRILCWVGMDADITEIKNIETQLRVANAELEAFSYSVSHDLRSPLATLQGFSRQLAERLEGSGDSKALHYADRIGHTALYMGELLDGLLALAQVSRRPVRREAVDLTRMARDVLERLRRDQPGRETDVFVEEGLVAHADARMMHSLLENLLGNAWKFTALKQPARIEVGRRVGSGEDQFYVHDNGAGFDMAHASQLFTAFNRLHDSREFPGTGIGLATVHRIVTRHQGQIWAKAVPGEGATFYFTLGSSAA
jgi:PAS domain S-box-containing protein